MSLRFIILLILIGLGTFCHATDLAELEHFMKVVGVPESERAQILNEIATSADPEKAKTEAKSEIVEIFGGFSLMPTIPELKALAAQLKDNTGVDLEIVLYVNGVAGKAKSLSNASKKFAEGAYKENVEPALRVVLQVWKDEKGYWLNKTDLAKQPLITPLRQADGAFPVDLQKSMTDKFYSVLTANAFYNGAMTSKAYVIAATKAMIEEGLAKTLARKPEKNDNRQILAILKLIKEQGAKKKDMTVHVPNTTDNPNTLVGIDLNIEKNDYERIRFKNFATTEPSYIDPTQYKTEANETNKWASINFYNKNKADELIFNFTIFDDDYKEKRDSLKVYLNGCKVEDYYGDIVDNPEIAPTQFGGDKKKGMYGCTRLNTKTSNYTKPCNDEKVGELYKRFHGGIDIEIISGITELKAAIDGKIVIHDLDDGDLGKWVQITGTSKESKVITYLYGHLNSISVKDGADIKKGSIIGIGGETGNAANVDVKHCHVQIKIDGDSNDPNGYFKTKFDANGNKIN